LGERGKKGWGETKIILTERGGGKGTGLKRGRLDREYGEKKGVNMKWSSREKNQRDEQRRNHNIDAKENEKRIKHTKKKGSQFKNLKKLFWEKNLGGGPVKRQQKIRTPTEFCKT